MLRYVKIQFKDFVQGWVYKIHEGEWDYPFQFGTPPRLPTPGRACAQSEAWPMTWMNSAQKCLVMSAGEPNINMSCIHCFHMFPRHLIFGQDMSRCLNQPKPSIQMRNSFYHYAMRYQEILRQRWQESSPNIVDDCWFQGGLSPEMCCIPAGTGTDWCFDAVYTYERCCKGIQAPAAWVPSKAALPEVRDQPNFVEPDGTLSARPQLTVDLFIRSRFADS